MKHFTVHAPPEGEAEDVAFVKDGFNWPAFFVPPVWFIVKGQWLWLVFYLLALALIATVAAAGNLPGDTSMLVVAAVNLLVGLEANDLHRDALARRGLAFLGPAAANDLDQAELDFFSARERFHSAADGVTGTSEDDVRGLA